MYLCVYFPIRQRELLNACTNATGATGAGQVNGNILGLLVQRANDLAEMEDSLTAQVRRVAVVMPRVQYIFISNPNFLPS